MICRLCKNLGLVWRGLYAEPCPDCAEPLVEDDVEPSEESMWGLWEDLGDVD